jgi:hypothetical protein
MKSGICDTIVELMKILESERKTVSFPQPNPQFRWFFLFVYFDLGKRDERWK